MEQIYTYNFLFDSGLLIYDFDEDLKQFGNRILQLKKACVNIQDDTCACEKFWLYQIESDYYAVCLSFVVNFLKLNDLTLFLSAFYDNCEFTDQFDTDYIPLKNEKCHCCLSVSNEYSLMMSVDGFCQTCRIDFLEKKIL